MPIPKILGIETEYGVFESRARVQNPTALSTLLVNAYAREAGSRVGWDFASEHPAHDARMFGGGVEIPDPDQMVASTVTVNGARFYVDHAHPEYSSPECSSPEQATLYDLAGEEILRRAMMSASLAIPDREIVVYKNNSDGKGNSYGCHENYLVDREVEFSDLAAAIMGHFVTRQIFCGAGKIGAEAPNAWYPDGQRPWFQISQRADFMEEEVGLETTMRRPIVNTRDEPHADSERFRRLHVIVGDSNRSQIATYLKLATTAAILVLIETGWRPRLIPTNPVAAIRAVSCDLGLKAAFEVEDLEGSVSCATAVELQSELLEAVERYNSQRGLQELGDAGAGDRLIDQWAAVIAGLESDPSSVANCIDWLAKKQVIDAFVERNGDAGSSRTRALDLQYHDLRSSRSVFDRLAMKELCSADEVMTAANHPPHTTRAYFRGEFLRRWPASVVTANWDSMVIDSGESALRRIPMPDPTRGTAAMVGGLFDRSRTVVELLAALERQ